MDKNNQKKYEQLGMPFGTANAKLHKSILFKLIQAQGLDICYQCGEKIDAIDQLSIEHKQPWQSAANPIESFFDLNNIAFSHIHCNIAHARKTYAPHGSRHRYAHKGCRCELCTAANTAANYKYRHDHPRVDQRLESQP